MNNYKLTFSKNLSLKSDIENHLVRCSKLFKPNLDTYINLDSYSKKLFENACRYEVFFNGKLVGLVAVYFSENIGFISNFSIEREWIGKGVSGELMTTIIDDFKKNSINIIRLEVFKENERALSFYNKYGFIVENEDTLKLRLVKEL